MGEVISRDVFDPGNLGPGDNERYKRSKQVWQGSLRFDARLHNFRIQNFTGNQVGRECHYLHQALGMA